VTSPKRFDRFIGAIDRTDSQVRVRVVGDCERAFIHMEESYLESDRLNSIKVQTIAIMPDEVESLSAFLRSAVAAIRQEQKK